MAAAMEWLQLLGRAPHGALRSLNQRSANKAVAALVSLVVAVVCVGVVAGSHRSIGITHARFVSEVPVLADHVVFSPRFAAHLSQIWDSGCSMLPWYSGLLRHLVVDGCYALVRVLQGVLPMRVLHRRLLPA